MSILVGEYTPFSSSRLADNLGTFEVLLLTLLALLRDRFLLPV